MRLLSGAVKAIAIGLCMVSVSMLAGCLTAAAGTAKSTEGDATHEATSSFASDAKLVGIFGIEGSASGGGLSFSPWSGKDDGKTRDHMAGTEQDRRVGDGRCEVWAFAYRADSKPGQVFIVFVTRDGEREGTHTIEDDLDDLRPIGNYDVNSDAAVDAAKKENDGIRTALESESSWVMLALGRTGDYENPIWIVAAGGGGASSEGFGGAGGLVMIDAVTGRILMSHGGSGTGSQFGGWGGWEGWGGWAGFA